MTRKNQKIVPTSWGIKRMRKQCVPGAPPFFMRARDKAMAVDFFPIPALYLAAWDPKM